MAGISGVFLPNVLVGGSKGMHMNFALCLLMRLVLIRARSVLRCGTLCRTLEHRELLP